MMKRTEKPLFNQLKTRKEQGEQLSLKQITPENMRELWWKEINFDKDLAELFDVTEQEFKRYRYSLNVKQQVMEAQDYFEKFEKLSNQDLPSKLENISLSEITQTVQELEEVLSKLKKQIGLLP